MAKSGKRQTDTVVTTAPSTSKVLPSRATHVTDSDIARRAHDLYLARGCGDGGDVEDWLQAERELHVDSEC